MKPNQKLNAKKVVTVAWVILMTACGAAGSTSTPSSSTSSPAQDPVSVSNTATTPKDLKVGDLYQLVISGSESVPIDFSGVESGAEFTMSVSNLNTTGSSVPMQLASSESSLMDITEEHEDHPEVDSAATSFHEALRFQEMAFAASAELPASMSRGKSVQASESAPALGDVRRFQALASLSGGSSVTVTATLKCVGSNVLMYLDQEVDRRNPTDMSDADINKQCTGFDARIPKMRATFGEESDVNGDGKVVVLMTPQVNRMGAALGGLITGFFYAGDLYSMNQMEILYTLVPDSRGLYGSTIEKNFALTNLFPPVLVHEFQHAINYNQHVLLRGGTPEDPVFNEALSHLSEDLMGLGMENYARYAAFLSSPASYGLLSGGSPNLGTRGAAYLLLRYLYEQSANAATFIRTMVGSDKIGTANLEKAFAGRDSSFDQFGEFFMRWQSAIIMGSEGLSQDSRYSYRARVRHAETGEWMGVCLKCSTEDGRGTVLNGVTQSSYSGYTSSNLLAGGAQFYKMKEVASQVRLYGRGNGQFGAVLIRTR